MKQLSISSVALAVSSVVFLSACGVSNNEVIDRPVKPSIPPLTQSSGKHSTQASVQEVIAEPLKPGTTLVAQWYKKEDAFEHERFVGVLEEEVRRESGALSDSDQASPVIASAAAPMDRRVSEAKRVKFAVTNSSKAKIGSNYLTPQSTYIGQELVDRENYQSIAANPVHLTMQSPVSTFSIDVDTGSYSNVRRFINGGRLPQHNAVRVEELINYFNYDYPQSDSMEKPFLITTEVAPSPWNANSHLLHVGIKGYDVDRASLPSANLVFLVDVSGSMNSPQKIGLLKQSLKLITKKMRADDRISIVVYAGASGVVLEGKSGNDKVEILRAIDQFQAGGSTNGAAGIQLAYQLAKTHFIEGGINRVLLATDGDFNVGTVNFDALIDMVEMRRQTGISLTTLGFGQGNYNDHLMEQLADKGNGNYSYIDTLQEARKVLVEEMASTLHTIAKDVKIQVEFNPELVQEYRLIGYENRALKREDFNNDKVDAGEVGAGHSVTALYEITFKGANGNLVDPLRYGNTNTSMEKRTTLQAHVPQELAFVKLRYKQPDQDTSQLMSQAVVKSSVNKTFNSASDRFKFSAAVAGFGQILSGGNFTNDFTLKNVEEISVSSRGEDTWGYRSEFVSLVRLAESIQPQS